MQQEVRLRSPAWIEAHLSGMPQTYASLDERMQLVVSLAQQNVENGTGGPFSAAVFVRDTGRLISVGVNQVLQSGCAVAHAEVFAISLAQIETGTFDLGAQHSHSYQLVISAEPCLMCIGVIHWSGLRSLVFGARDEDIRAIGFDEGPKPPGWIKAWESQGIEIATDVQREPASKVIREYASAGGPIYNATRAC